jgi:glucokinase
VNTLAIDIGGTKFSMAVFSDGHMIRRTSEPTDRNGGRDWMLDRIVAIARGWQKDPGFGNCGVGFGGPVIFGQQRIALSTHVGGWSDYALPLFLKHELGVPVLMDNDANVGGLGEAKHGAGRSSSSLFYMTLSTGIGGGIITEHGIHRGADSYGGEIGHLTIRPEGPICLCGARGCFERLCCGLWLERDHGRAAKELLQDPAFVERYVVDLSLGLKAALMLLNPARIVIGGGMSKAGDKLFLPLRHELGRQMTSWSRARIDVVPAELGDDSVLWGALELSRELTS